MFYRNKAFLLLSSDVHLYNWINLIEMKGPTERNTMSTYLNKFRWFPCVWGEILSLCSIHFSRVYRCTRIVGIFIHEKKASFKNLCFCFPIASKTQVCTLCVFLAIYLFEIYSFLYIFLAIIYWVSDDNHLKVSS